VVSQQREFVGGRPNRLFFTHIIRKIFLEDWVLKLVALVITLGLWLGVTGLSSPKVVRFSGVPLTLRVSNNTEITNSPPLEIEVVISGDKRRLAELNKGDLSASIDLTDVSPGEKFIPLTPESVHVTLPPGIKLDEVQPQRIPVTIEPVGEKELPVTAETSGELAEGFELYNATVLPAKVHVRGPASFLKTLSGLSTDHVDLTGHDEDFVARQVTIPLGNPKATVLENVVDVAVRIGEKRAERTVTISASGEHLQKRAVVTLFGPKSLLQNIKPANIRLDLVKNDSGEEMPQAVLPEEFRDSVEIRNVKLRP
jgi:YbbR domain-containing protein